MRPVTGSLSIKSGDTYYSLHFASQGWVAADMVQYLPDIYRREDPKIGILKLLGYTMEMNQEAPPRVADHWVEVFLEERRLATNSQLIRKAVKKEPPSEKEPYLSLSLENIYAALDGLDYSVELFGG